MRRNLLCTVLLCASLLRAQPPTPRAPAPPSADLHRPSFELLPIDVFEHLEAGAARAQRLRIARLAEAELASPWPKSRPAPKPARRPAGAGQRLAMVFCCAESDAAPHELLLQERRDLLVVANPGPVIRREEVELLERTIRDDDLALAVVLLHRECEATNVPPREEHDASPAAAPTALSQEARAVELARSVFRASALAERRRSEGRFEVVAAIVEPDGEVKWISPWIHRPLLGRVEIEAEPGGARAPADRPVPTDRSSADPARPPRH